MPVELSEATIRARFFEAGHSFDEIDNMSIEDMGLVLGYWAEKSRAEAAFKEEQRRLSKHKKGG